MLEVITGAKTGLEVDGALDVNCMVICTQHRQLKEDINESVSGILANMCTNDYYMLQQNLMSIYLQISYVNMDSRVSMHSHVLLFYELHVVPTHPNIKHLLPPLFSNVSDSVFSFNSQFYISVKKIYRHTVSRLIEMI